MALYLNRGGIFRIIIEQQGSVLAGRADFFEVQKPERPDMEGDIMGASVPGTDIRVEKSELEVDGFAPEGADIGKCVHVGRA